MKPKTSEKNLEKYFVAQIKKRGGRAIKMDGSIMAGIPDRLVLMPQGFVAFAELKTSIGRKSAIQEHTQGLIKALGVRVTTLYGRLQVDDYLAELDAFLEELSDD